MERRERETMLTAQAPIKTVKNQKGKKKLKRNDKQQIEEIERDPVQYFFQ